MKKLTDKELEIMDVLWEQGKMTIRSIMEKLSNPVPHFNTVATYVRRLENHDMIRHEAIGPKFYMYEAAVSKQQYADSFSKENIKKLFSGSYMDFISKLVEEREVSVDELKELIKMVEED